MGRHRSRRAEVVDDDRDRSLEHWAVRLPHKNAFVVEAGNSAILVDCGLAATTGVHGPEEAVKYLLAGANVVMTTSSSGLYGNFGQANYGAAKLGIVALSRSIAGDMKRYNVRSNCISPFAWSRMIGSIPTDTPEQKARVEKLKKLDTAQIAPMAAFLASDAAAEVTSQIFAVRGNEIFLMSQPRPVRGMHTAEGWTPETIAERVLPAMKPNFFPLESSAVVFSWDPV